MSTEEERDIIDLIDYASTKQSKRNLDELERLVDVGDRLLAQRILIDSNKLENIQAATESTVPASTGDPSPDFLEAGEGTT